MRIIDSRIASFSELEKGDTFEYQGFIMMKTDTSGEFNSVYIANGKLDYFDDGTYVKKLDCDFVIRCDA